MPSRPIIPMPIETTNSILEFQIDSNQNPPLPYRLPNDLYDAPKAYLQIAPKNEVQYTQRYSLKRKIWDARRKRKSFDSIPDPYANLDSNHGVRLVPRCFDWNLHTHVHPLRTRSQSASRDVWGALRQSPQVVLPRSPGFDP